MIQTAFFATPSVLATYFSWLCKSSRTILTDTWFQMRNYCRASPVSKNEVDLQILAHIVM